MGRLVVSMNLSLDGYVQASGQDEFDYSWMHPAALGAGVPFFRERVDMKLLDVRRFESGALALRYATRSG
jgi:hypothetical protein